MDYEFNTTPGTFTADLAALDVPTPVKEAIAATWAATDQSQPTYQVHTAIGTYWSVVRIAAVLEA